jgi:NADH-quinone oxidoreductase subunit L
MKGPLVALAIPSLVIGYLTIQPILFGGYFQDSIRVLENHYVVGELAKEWHGPVAFALDSFAGFAPWLAAAGVLAAWYFVLYRPQAADAAQRRFSAIHELLCNKYYFDWFNEQVIVRLTRGIGNVLWRGGDQAVIDGAMVNGSANFVGWLAGVARQLQSGFLYSYAFWMIIGLAVLLGWFLIHT